LVDGNEEDVRRIWGEIIVEMLCSNNMENGGKGEEEGGVGGGGSRVEEEIRRGVFKEVRKI
jgi:hypothetical protein